MEMTPEMIPAVEWVSCRDKLPTPGTFVWIVVGKVVEVGCARRYVREVHMGVLVEDQHFKIYPYNQPLISNQIWAWALMMPPAPPACKQTDHEGEEWKDA